MPDRTAQTLAAALQSEQKGDLEHALSILNSAIEDGLEDVLIFSNRGRLLERLGQNAKALESFRKAAEMEPNFRDHYNAGNMLLMLGRFEEAIPHYVESLRCRDDYPDCWVNKGIAHHQLQQIAAARKSFERALEFDPAFYPALRSLAILHANEEEKEEAKRAFLQAAQARPQDAEAWFEYACYLYKQLETHPNPSFDPKGAEGTAVQALDKTLELDPSKTGAWGRKIGVLFRLADQAKNSDQNQCGTESPQLLPLILAELVQTIESAMRHFPDDPWFKERLNDAQSLASD